MKHILVIDESQLFRDYAKKKLEDYGFEVSVAISGLDGSSKLRTLTPDLLITDYHLTRKSALDMLKEKQANPNTAGIPVILASAKIDRNELVAVSRYNVKKFLTKPIRVDSLLQAVGETLNVPVKIDDTPCIIEAHVNDDVLFVEVAQGLNREKVDLLGYKIRELLDLYSINVPKVLLLMTSLEVSNADSLKLTSLFNTILESSGVAHKYFKVLTNSRFVKEFVHSRTSYADIEVTSNLEHATEALWTHRSGKPEGTEVVNVSAPKKNRDESIHLRFHQDAKDNAVDLSSLGDSVEIAIVDDDPVIQELLKTAFADTKVSLFTFNNGRAFMDDGRRTDYDLVFLDLMMPEMDGFQVLMKLKEEGLRLPIIVLSALSKRETVIQALRMGVSSYMIKPLKPQAIRKKASEVLQLNF